MNEQEILEIRMVAQFMGITVTEFGGMIYRSDEDDGMPDLSGGDECYFPHLSWNDLMPVVERIETLHVPTSACLNCEKDRVSLVSYPNVSKTGRYYSRFVSLTSDNWYIADNGADSKIEAVYKSVVAFIKWYNTQSLPIPQ